MADPRDDAQLTRTLTAIPPSATRDERMAVFVRAFWVFASQHRAGEHPWCSWAGFYTGPGTPTPEGEVPGADEMLLAVREPKPACSPIGLHGACGRSYLERRTLVVTDVERLGAGYVACDPLDRSELVIPCIDESGEAWGVLDLDSFAADAFTEDDAAQLHAALVAAGLTRSEPAPVVVI